MSSCTNKKVNVLQYIFKMHLIAPQPPFVQSRQWQVETIFNERTRLNWYLRISDQRLGGNNGLFVTMEITIYLFLFSRRYSVGPPSSDFTVRIRTNYKESSFHLMNILWFSFHPYLNFGVSTLGCQPLQMWPLDLFSNIINTVCMSASFCTKWNMLWWH